MTQFIPYMIFLVSIINFYLLALDEKHFTNDDFVMHLLYFPYFGFCSILLINQIASECVQLRNEKSYHAYFTSIWNWNDNLYMILSVFLLFNNMYSLIPLRE